MINEVLDKLQTVDPLIWTTLAAYFAPYAQEALKHVKEFGEKSNYFIALVVIPGVIAAVTGLQSSDVLNGVHPLVATALTATLAAVVSQLRYGLSLKPKMSLKQELEALRAQQSTVYAEPTQIVAGEDAQY